MINEEEYSSDTSDEDFIPHAEEAESEEASGSENENEEHEISPKSKRRKAQKTGRSKKQKTKTNPLLAAVSTPEKEIEMEKSFPEDKKEEESKVESLWADFLADVEEKTSEGSKVKPKSKSFWGALLSNKNKTSLAEDTPIQVDSNSTSSGAATSPQKKPSMVKVTKVYEFAGEEVRVEKEVDANSAEGKALFDAEKKTDSYERPSKRVGLSNIVTLLDKKKQKLSTLEKTQIDWVKFKTAEGIEEELRTHLRSKEGYLEKQDFLERADLRQFEIERSMRMSRKSNR